MDYSLETVVETAKHKLECSLEEGEEVLQPWVEAWRDGQDRPDMTVVCTSSDPSWRDISFAATTLVCSSECDHLVIIVTCFATTAAQAADGTPWQDKDPAQAFAEGDPGVYQHLTVYSADRGTGVVDVVQLPFHEDGGKVFWDEPREDESGTVAYAIKLAENAIHTPFLGSGEVGAPWLPEEQRARMVEHLASVENPRERLLESMLSGVVALFMYGEVMKPYDVTPFAVLLRPYNDEEAAFIDAKVRETCSKGQMPIFAAPVSELLEHDPGPWPSLNQDDD